MSWDHAFGRLRKSSLPKHAPQDQLRVVGHLFVSVGYLMNEVSSLLDGQFISQVSNLLKFLGIEMDYHQRYG